MLGYLLLGAGTLLEISARPLEGGKSFSLAAAIFLALSWAPAVGPLPVLLAAGVGAVLRLLMGDAQGHLKGAFVSFLTLLAAIGVPKLLSGVSGSDPSWQLITYSLLVYLVLDFTLPGRLLDGAQGELFAQQYRLLPLTVGACLCAPLIFQQFLQGQSLTLGLVPFLFACQFAAPGVLMEEKARRVDRMDRKARKAEEAAEQSDQMLQQRDRDLQLQLSERGLLEKLGRSFVDTTDMNSVYQVACESISKSVECRSVAFFTMEEGKLEGRYSLGPWQNEVKSASLLGLREPLIEECFLSRRVLLKKQKHRHGELIFKDEEFGAAFPLGALGVLYVGRKGGSDFTRETLRVIAVVADQARLAGQAAGKREELQRVLLEQQAGNERLKMANERLTRVLEGAAVLSQTLEPSSLLQVVKQVCFGLLPRHTAGAALIHLRDVEHVLTWPENDTWVEGFRAVSQVCRESGLALNVESLAVSRFQEAQLGEASSLLAAPVGTEGDVVGSVVLLQEQKAAFSASDQDALAALCLQLRAVLKASAYYEDFKESQAHLVQSTKMAAVGQLSAGLAHEINTPLAAIRIAVQAARRNAQQGQTEKLLSKLERAEKATRLAQEILSQLLIFSRPSSAEISVIDLAEATTDAVGMIRGQFEQEKVGLEVSGMDEPVKVLANKNGVHQAILNLLLNARDAVLESGSEKPLVQLSLETTAQFGRLRVIDNGVGVPEEARGRLFEPFFTTKEVGKGTGLGLSVSRSLIEGYQGRLLLGSAPSQGACFELELPSALVSQRPNVQQA